MINPPYKVCKTEIETKFGKDFEISIATEYDHPQLKAPAPVVTISTTIGKDDKILKTIYIDENDAEFIVRACNSHELLVNALQSFVSNVENWIKTDIPADSNTPKLIFENAKKAIAKATSQNVY